MNTNWFYANRIRIQVYLEACLEYSPHSIHLSAVFIWKKKIYRYFSAICANNQVYL